MHIPLSKYCYIKLVQYISYKHCVCLSIVAKFTSSCLWLTRHPGEVETLAQYIGYIADRTWYLLGMGNILILPYIMILTACDNRIVAVLQYRHIVFACLVCFYVKIRHTLTEF